LACRANVTRGAFGYPDCALKQTTSVGQWGQSKIKTQESIPMKTITSASSVSYLRPLADRVAVVTGASSGIRRATAMALAARGAKVAVIARRQDQLDQIAAEI